jgi:cephalosporin hydroxylase
MSLHMEECLDMPLRDVLDVIQSRIIKKTSYWGVPARKSPLDSWVYQEIIFEMKPDVIVEIGTMFGGSTLALAHMLDTLGHGKIIGLDITHEKVPNSVRQHPRITLIEGDACENFQQVKRLLSPDDNILVIEDSSHTYENTLNVLRTYSALTSPGNYFIVEDSICHHGLTVGPNPGPYEAIETFIDENPDFEIDRSKESFLITWNPKGYLRRKA